MTWFDCVGCHGLNVFFTMFSRCGDQHSRNICPYGKSGGYDVELVVGEFLFTHVPYETSAQKTQGPPLVLCYVWD